MEHTHEPVFACAMCGQCCMGEGGIILGPEDTERLRRRFGLNREAFLAEYAVLRNGKYAIRTGPDGSCLFFRVNAGCTVHADKPSVCRAWPFFRGNMVDETSLNMAREFCPGISKTATHAEFVAEGRAYLRANNLLNHDPVHGANALLPDDMERAR